LVVAALPESQMDRQSSLMKIILALLVSLGLFSTIVPSHAGDVEEAARAYNGLGFQLLAQCRQSLPKTNYFLSPAGLAFALSMVQNGAQGETLAPNHGHAPGRKHPVAHS
jgi:serine protease inhibitor